MPKSIIKIIKILDEGICLTTSLNDVHYILTEYGIADLWGKTVQQRGNALIEIAHPNFRNQLKQDFNSVFESTVI